MWRDLVSYRHSGINVANKIPWELTSGELAASNQLFSMQIEQVSPGRDV